MKGANSFEFDEKTKHPVIHLMETQRGVEAKGATMRLGAYPCKIARESHAFRIYGKGEISERHRHRYEVNNDYREKLEQGGLVASGVSPDGSLVELMELKEHPWFVGCQFHPEFQSKPMDAHPLFRSFIKASLDRRNG